MGAYHCGVTPETQDRNPFISIAVLVVVMALVAGLATRFGINSLIAAICIAIAMFGTWVLLSPQIEILESALAAPGDAQVATAGAAASGGLSSESAFAGKPASATRERLFSAICAYDYMHLPLGAWRNLCRRWQPSSLGWQNSMPKQF